MSRPAVFECGLHQFRRQAFAFLPAQDSQSTKWEFNDLANIAGRLTLFRHKCAIELTSFRCKCAGRLTPFRY